MSRYFQNFENRTRSILTFFFCILLKNQLGDRWGRRYCLVISLAMNGIFGLFSSFARNYLQLVFCRLMAGIGVGGSIPLLFTYASEMVPQHNKGYYMSILSLNWMVSCLKQNLKLYIYSQMGFYE